jgi:hypothetical protein
MALGAAPADHGGDDKPPPGRLHVSSNVVGFPVPGLAALTAGYIDATQPLRVRVSGVGNQAWEMYLHSLDVDLGNGKPLDHLLWREVGSSAWKPVGNASSLLAQGQRPEDVNVEFRMLLNWYTDRPGTYGGDVIIELYVQ